MCCLPIGVVLRKRVWDMCTRHQHKCPEQMNDTAAGQEEERPSKRDSILIQQLKEIDVTIMIQDFTRILSFSPV